METKADSKKAKTRETPIAIITIPAKAEKPENSVMIIDKYEEMESKHTSSSASFDTPAKRSKSEEHKDQAAAVKMNMNRARKNFMRKRELSPNKLDAQIRQR